MKKGWIQVNKDGAFEDIAPNTMANQVYMDDTMTKTVKEAITGLENGSSGGGSGSPSDDVVHALQQLQAFEQRPAGFATAAQGSKADAALPASQYTAQDTLNKLVSLGGNNVCENIGALYQHPHAATADCNAIVKTGLYYIINAQNGPSDTGDTQCSLLVIAYLPGNPGWVRQTYYSPHGLDTWERFSNGNYANGGTWSPWKKTHS